MESMQSENCKKVYRGETVIIYDTTEEIIFHRKGKIDLIYTLDELLNIVENYENNKSKT